MGHKQGNSNYLGSLRLQPIQQSVPSYCIKVLVV